MVTWPFSSLKLWRYCRKLHLDAGTQGGTDFCERRYVLEGDGCKENGW